MRSMRASNCSKRVRRRLSRLCGCESVRPCVFGGGGRVDMPLDEDLVLVSCPFELLFELPDVLLVLPRRVFEVRHFAPAVLQFFEEAFALREGLAGEVLPAFFHSEAGLATQTALRFVAQIFERSA